MALNPPKNFSLVNGCGLTECTIFITIFKVEKSEARIGRAILFVIALTEILNLSGGVTGKLKFAALGLNFRKLKKLFVNFPS